MEILYSKDNSTIIDIKKLKEKKHRTAENKFLVEGFRFVIEALESDFLVPLVFISEGQIAKCEKFNIYDKIQSCTEVVYVKDSLFNTLVATDTPQGIGAIVINKHHKVEKESVGLYLLVDGVQDPGNLGTIIRTADAAGALGVILLKGTVDPYNEKTLRSTMGSIFHIPIIMCDQLDIINSLIDSGFKLVVSSLEAENNFFQERLSGKIIMTVGNEGYGVSKEIQLMADIRVKIPMPGKAESLNVAIASSIMIYEYIRQNL